MTREKIYGLSGLCITEQIYYLEKNDILDSHNYKCPNCGYALTESLVNCADRLWRDATDSNLKSNLKKGMRLIYFLHHPDIDEISDDELTAWFLFKSSTIHRIQAALLAKEIKSL